MIHAELLREQGILIITPEGELQQADFESLAQLVDPYIIETEGELHGVLIFTESFPGWADFAALLSHLKFVKNHHQHIAKIAAVTGSQFLTILPAIVSHFVHAKVRHFVYGDKQEALEWLQSKEE
ncbi:MAG: STAS/SEC14 domain-containing protein [Methylobacter sp.]